VVKLKGPHLTSYRSEIHSRTELHSLEELVSAVTDSLLMPRCPTKRAVRILERITGKPFFAEDAGGDTN
jgi:hypothetical protein